jgi:hypothetical protein
MFDIEALSRHMSGGDDEAFVENANTNTYPTGAVNSGDDDDEGDDDEGDDDEGDDDEFWFRAHRLSKFIYRSGGDDNVD